MALPLVLLLAACTSDAEPPDALDEARRAALVKSLWAWPQGSSAGGPAVTGPYRPYDRPSAGWFETRAGSTVDVARTELAAATAAGWTPIFGICPGATAPLEQAHGEDLDPEALVLQLTRALPDAPAFVRLTFRAVETRGAAPDPSQHRVQVAVDAYTLYHLDTQTPRRAPSADVEQLSCLGTRGGPGLVGVPAPISERGIVDVAEREEDEREWARNRQDAAPAALVGPRTRVE